MYLCEDSHPEIVHDNGYRSCPLCEALNKIAVLESEAENLKEKLSEADGTIDELEANIKYLEKEIK